MWSLKNKSILIISPEAWGTNYVSKHHYAHELANWGCQVFFLGPAGTTQEIIPVSKGLWVLNQGITLRGLRYYPNWLSGLLTRREFKRLEKYCGTKFQIIWNFDSSRFFNLSYLQDVLKIAHIVDLTEDFNRSLLVRTSDVALCSSRFIMREISQHQSRVFKLHHGYSGSSASTSFRLEPNHPHNAVYVGNLSSRYIDWEILLELALQNQQVGFYFIGPEGKSNLGASAKPDPQKEHIKTLGNCYFTGEKPSQELPGILQQFDILLLAYKSQAFGEQLANPHKLMQYLGSGKVVLATHTVEFEEEANLVEMVALASQMPAKFKQVMNDLPAYNSLERQDHRRRFALEHTYNRQLQRIEKLIQEAKELTNDR